MTGLPVGAAASFNPSSCTPPVADGSSCASPVRVAITVPPSVTAGTYPLTVTDNGPLFKSVSFDLVVTSFDFSVTRDADITAVQGGSGSTLITVTSRAGTPADVTLSVPNLPAGVTAAFTKSGQPNTVCTASELATSCTRTLTLSPARGGSPAAGPYDRAVTGTAGSAVNTAPLTLTVTSSMTVGLEPASASGPAPHTTDFTAKVLTYSGDPQDDATYKFWKDCNVSGDNIAELEGPRDADSCGPPDVQRTTNATAETDQTVFTSIRYDAQGAYTPKLVVERRAAKSWKNGGVTVGAAFNYDLSVSPSGSLTVARGASDTAQDP